MKTSKLLILASVAMILIACNPLEPDIDNLIGKWFVKDSERNIELTFDEGNQLIYYYGPTGTETWAGNWIYGTYKIEKNLMYLYFLEPINSAYSTGFSISNNVLIIEQFPYKGNNERLILTKKK